MYLYYHGNVSKLFDPFSGLSYLALSAALVPMHSCWENQLIITVILLSVAVFQQIDRHRVESVAERVFLISVLLGLVSFLLPSVVLLLVPCALLLAYRQAFNGQSLMAILLGLGLVAIYASLFVWLGWIEPVWLDFFSSSFASRWLSIGALCISYILNTIAYSGDGMWRGITFLTSLFVCVVGWLCLLFI